MGWVITADHARRLDAALGRNSGPLARALHTVSRFGWPHTDGLRVIRSYLLRGRESPHKVSELVDVLVEVLVDLGLLGVRVEGATRLWDVQPPDVWGDRVKQYLATHTAVPLSAAPVSPAPRRMAPRRVTLERKRAQPILINLAKREHLPPPEPLAPRAARVPSNFEKMMSARMDLGDEPAAPLPSRAWPLRTAPSFARSVADCCEVAAGVWPYPSPPVAGEGAPTMEELSAFESALEQSQDVETRNFADLAARVVVAHQLHRAVDDGGGRMVVPGLRPTLARPLRNTSAHLGPPQFRGSVWTCFRDDIQLFCRILCLPNELFTRWRCHSSAQERLLAAVSRWMWRPRSLHQALAEVLDEELVLADWTRNVPEKLRSVLERHYLAGRPMTLKTLADEWGVSRERVRQVGVQALSYPGHPRFRAFLDGLLAARRDRILARLRAATYGFTKTRTAADLHEALAPLERLLVTLTSDGITDWLQRQERDDPLRMAALKGRATGRPLDPRIAQLAFPAPLARVCDAAGMNRLDVEWAVGCSGSHGLFEGYVVTTPLCERTVTLVKAHRHLASHGFVTVDALRAACGSGLATPTIRRALDGATHLFVTLDQMKWSVVPGSAAPLDGVTTVNWSPRWKEDSRDDTVLPAMLDYVGRERAVTATDVVRGTGRERASVQGLLVTSGAFCRMAPGIFCLAGRERDQDTLASGRFVALESRACRNYVRARHAGEPAGLFPLWDAEMEKAWCIWGEEALEEQDYRSLLSVARPEEWKASQALKRRFAQLQRSHGRYELRRARSRPLAFRFALASVSRAALMARVQGRLSHASCNIAAGCRMDFEQPTTAIMALLIATGALRAAEHWEDDHRVGEEIDAILEGLAAPLRRTGRLSWTGDEGRWLLARAREGMVRVARPCWFSGAELEALLDLLGNLQEEPAGGW